MTRREEREFALQILYGLEFNEISIAEMTERLNETQYKKVTDFTRRLLEQTVENKEELDQMIMKQLKNWDYQRVAVIDKILLRMAIVEFLYFEAIPPQATLNEMIEISKAFSTDRSGKFINGILDAILKNLRKKNKMHKSGRGLVH